jgi:heptosyltransferase-3
MTATNALKLKPFSSEQTKLIDLESIRRITVFHGSTALGDTLLTVPVLRALRAGIDGVRIHLVGASEPAALLQSAGLVDNWSWAGDTALAGLATGEGSPSLYASLHGPDLVLAYTARTESASQALGAVGVPFVVVNPTSDHTRHAAEQLLSALISLEIEAPWRGPSAVAAIDLGGRTDANVGRSSTSSVNSMQAASDGRILIHPGSGARWKCAPPHLFATVAQELIRADFEPEIIEGPADADAVDAMRWAGRILHPTSLPELASALAPCQGYLGNDSGVSHLAGLLGIPAVVLFGPTSPETWLPLGPKVGVVRTCKAPTEEPARGADLSYFDELTAEMVVSALLDTMAD